MGIKKTEVKNKKAKASGSDKKVSISSILNNPMIDMVQKKKIEEEPEEDELEDGSDEEDYEEEVDSEDRDFIA